MAIIKKDTFQDQRPDRTFLGLNMPLSFYRRQNSVSGRSLSWMIAGWAIAIFPRTRSQQKLKPQPQRGCKLRQVVIRMIAGNGRSQPREMLSGTAAGMQTSLLITTCIWRITGSYVIFGGTVGYSLSCSATSSTVSLLSWYSPTGANFHAWGISKFHTSADDFQPRCKLMHSTTEETV